MQGIVRVVTGGSGGGGANVLGSFPFDCACPHRTVTDLFVPIYFTLAGHIELSTGY